VSVAALGFAFGNPFNGTAFAAAAVALALLGLRASGAAAPDGGTLTSVIGIAMVAFGWIYPHFVGTHLLGSLYAAPVGLVPCPTLAVTIGFALIGGTLGARAWSVVLAAFGLFYGLFGVVILGVYLDLGLVFGHRATIDAVVRGLQLGRPAADEGPHRRARLQIAKGDHLEQQVCVARVVRQVAHFVEADSVGRQ
jgi:hypothetical protein